MDQGRELLTASAATLNQLENEALAKIAALHGESLEKLKGKADAEIEIIRAERDRAIAEWKHRNGPQKVIAMLRN